MSDRRGVRRLDVLDGLAGGEEFRAVFRADFEEGELHVLGGEGLLVAEIRRLEMEGVGQAVGRDLPGFGEARHDLEAFAEAHHRVIERAAGEDIRHADADIGVEHGRVGAEHGDRGPAGLRRLGGQGKSRAERQRADREEGSSHRSLGRRTHEISPIRQPRRCFTKRACDQMKSAPGVLTGARMDFLCQV